MLATLEPLRLSAVCLKSFRSQLNSLAFNYHAAVRDRLDFLLDRQDRGETLTLAERQEAEGLVELSEFLSLLRLRSHSPIVK